jgi:diacylglycerol O-acyltransferase / wax synthase
MADRGYERLTQLDHSFLIYEGPSAPMHVGSTLIFEAGPLRRPGGGIDFERIEEYVLSRLHRIPRYRQRIAWTPLARDPVWVDDARFNVRYHLRHARLPRPGSERLLKRMAGRILSQHLDRGKPLWELWVIEGLEGDRVALVAKTHHCMIDGISAVDLLSVLLTPEPTEKAEPPPAWVPRPVPSGARLRRDELLWRARIPLDVASAGWRVVRNAGHEREVLRERLEATARLLRSGMGNASPTPLNQPIGPYRRVDWLSMDLDAIRRVKQRLGGTVNDVVLAVVAGGVRSFLGRRRGIDVDRLDFRVMAPVSTRSATERGTLGNRVAAWIVPLPVGEPDARRRLTQIRETTAELKRTRQALGADTLSRVTEWTGSTWLSLGARLVTAVHPFNLVVTNVPGPRGPLHLLTARLLEAHPMVPLIGNLATGIALFSYGGRLSWGFTADWDLVPDLHDFAKAIEHAFRRLERAAAEEA